MINHDHLWWIKSTYDGWRRLKMLFWAIRASIPTKNYENKTVCVFFQGASDGNAPGRRNISQKSKNNEKLNFLKIDFLKIQLFVNFGLLAYISTSGSITIRRALKKHAPCLIFIVFGWNRGPNSPKQHLESSSAIISTLNPS